MRHGLKGAHLLNSARLSLMCRIVSRLYATWKEPATSSAVTTSAISKLTCRI